MKVPKKLHREREKDMNNPMGQGKSCHGEAAQPEQITNRQGDEKAA